MAVLRVATSSSQDLVLSGPILAALVFALLAGLVSFFSPCVLPLVPVYLSYVTGVSGNMLEEAPKRPGARSWSGSRRTLSGAVLFVVGFAIVFTSYGALFGQLGQSLARHQGTLIRVSGVVTIVMGLLFAGAFERWSVAGRTFRPGFRPRAGLVGAPLLGGLFAIGWTPCIGPTLAAVLTLSTTSATAGRGAVLIFAYSLGLGIPFVMAAAGVGRAATAFAWARTRAGVVARAGGVLLVVVGLLQLSGAWSAGLAQLQGVLVGWQSPL